jgi:NADH-quinone oxidoreductase subunit N
MSMPVPSVEYGQLSPMLIVFGVAIVGVLIEAFVPRAGRYLAQLVVCLAGLLAALVAVVVLAMRLRAPGVWVVMGAVAVDGPALFLQGTLVLVGLLAVLLIAERSPARAVTAMPVAAGVAATTRGGGGFDAFTPQGSAVPGSVVERETTAAGIMQTEVFPLSMFALGGMLLFPAADDLLTMFVALEVLSLPLYLLCGLARRRRLLSQEAALKYFLLGAFSSAFFLYGVALLYGYAGTLRLAGIAGAISAGRGNTAMALIGVALLTVGVLFKVGAVPFHSWIPDVYQGAPTPITGFMAAATKIAAFGAMLRIFYVALPGLAADWRPVLWAVAILTMTVATITAITQTDVKRMLAYSSIAHTGFILIGVIAANQAGLSATMFYLFAYGFTTIGAFAVVSLVRTADGAEDTDMTHWAGLGRRSPLLALTFSLFLLAFAGIPLTSGFVGKFAVFKAAAQGGATPLVIVGVIASGIAAYFYVRVIVLMFFTDPPREAPHVVKPSILHTTALSLAAAITVALGALPQPLIDLSNNAAQFLR